MQMPVIEYADNLTSLATESKIFLDNGIEIPKKKAVLINGKPVAVVSETYKVFQNSEMVDVVSNAIEDSGLDTEGMRSQSRFDGKRAFVEYIFPRYTVEPKVGDVVQLRIVAKNSYDGGWSFGLLAGGFRLICLNGQIVGSYAKAYSRRHSAGFQLDDMGGRILAIKEAFSTEGNRWAAYANTEADQMIVEYSIRKFCGLDQVGINPPDEFKPTPTYNKLKELWDSYRYELGENYWALFNTFTAYTTFHQVSVQTRARNEEKLSVIQDYWDEGKQAVAA